MYRHKYAARNPITAYLRQSWARVPRVKNVRPSNSGASMQRRLVQWGTCDFSTV
jgi:hypothetical protein